MKKTLLTQLSHLENVDKNLVIKRFSRCRNKHHDYTSGKRGVCQDKLINQVNRGVSWFAVKKKSKIY
jgi:hypothetical protein